MSDYLTDEEQVALIKRWLKNYGPAIVIGLVLAIAIIFGWTSWTNHRLRQAQTVATEYNQLINSNTPPRQIHTHVQQFIALYPKSSYASLAKLLLVKQQVVAGQWADAEANLQWVVNNAPSSAQKQIARLRLARVYIQDDKPQEAKNVLAAVDDAAFIDRAAAIEKQIPKN